MLLLNLKYISSETRVVLFVQDWLVPAQGRWYVVRSNNVKRAGCGHEVCQPSPFFSFPFSGGSS